MAVVELAHLIRHSSTVKSRQSAPVSPIRPSLTSCQGRDPRMTLSQSGMPYCTADACSTPLEMYATVPTLLTRGRTNPEFFTLNPSTTINTIHTLYICLLFNVFSSALHEKKSFHQGFPYNVPFYCDAAIGGFLDRQELNNGAVYFLKLIHISVSTDKKRMYCSVYLPQSHNDRDSAVETKRWQMNRMDSGYT